MTIGEFARRTWLSPKALRLYEARGLLVPAEVDASNGYRLYSEAQLDDARLIRSLRRIGMPLDQVAVALGGEERTLAVIESYWHQVERDIARQRRLVDYLRYLVHGQGAHEMHEVQTRHVPEQLVMTEQRYVDAAGLPGWIQQALGRQHRALGERGQLGPSLVVYHGDVGEDSDGPVEACTPIEPGAVDESVATRIEPAHTEAYTTLTASQVEYPQILHAYRAVEEWIQQSGHTIAGPAREVYFSDMSSASPDEPVADVAFPIADPPPVSRA